MSFVIVSLMIVVVVWLGIYMIAKWDEPIPLQSCHVKWTIVGALTEGIMIRRVFADSDVAMQLLLGIFAGCLMLACITDSIICQVYCFVWWIGMSAGVLLLLRMSADVPSLDFLVLSGGGLFLFGIFQYYVLGRTYGRADCHAFFSCALVETALGTGMEAYLIHMILAYLLLGFDQLRKRNVSKCGKLLCPVPFLPYISVSFWLTILVLV